MTLVCTYSNVDIYDYDINTLAGCSWVNDAIVHIHGLLVEHENSNIRCVPPCSVQFIRFMDFSIVTQVLGDWKLNEFQTVFLPITNGTSLTERGTHWSLLIWQTRECRFFHLDSLGSGNISIASSLMKRIARNYGIQKPKLYTPWCVQQENSYDCGVFLMFYVKVICENNGNIEEAMKAVSQSQVTEFRRVLISRIRNMQ